MKQFLLLATLALLLTTGGTAQTKTEILTNKGVIELVKAGLGETVITSSIASSNCKFDLTSAGLIELKKQKVSDAIIKAMIDKADNKTTTAKSASITEPTAEKSTGTKSAPVKASGLNIDLLNYVHVLNNNKTRPLEKSTAGMRTKQGMFGGSAMWQIDGDHAGVRLGADEQNMFVINTGGSSLPEMVLYKVKSGKNRREVASMKVNSFSGVKTGEDVIPVDITKLKEGIYQLTPNKKLEKGEYFFAGKPVAGANSMDAFAFGVD